jgi:RNA polymerase sigma factor (sigma-70 family)
MTVSALMPRTPLRESSRGPSRRGRPLRTGDAAALRPFEEVVAEHGPVVMRVCRALLGPEDADDAWSETFLSALEAYPKLEPGSSIRGWLVTIAHRKAIDQLRGAARRPKAKNDQTEIPAADSASAGEASMDDELRAALDALPAKQRGAVIYRYLADLPYAEVGEMLESSASAARRSAADGIASLRRHLRKGPRHE